MSFFGARLLEERERLSLTQPELAEKCGITMRSQRNYEKGERSPDADYLAALAQQGLDVLYILTGQRSGLLSTPTNQDPDASLLAQVIVGVEQIIARSGKTISAPKKARMIVTLYRAVAAHKEVGSDALDEMVAKVM